MPDTKLGAVYNKIDETKSMLSKNFSNCNTFAISNTLLVMSVWKTICSPRFSLNMASSVKPFLIMPIRGSHSFSMHIFILSLNALILLFTYMSCSLTSLSYPNIFCKSIFPRAQQQSQ